MKKNRWVADPQFSCIYIFALNYENWVSKIAKGVSLLSLDGSFIALDPCLIYDTV